MTSCKGSLLSVRHGSWGLSTATKTLVRPAQRSVAVRWTRKEFEENELIQRYLARNPLLRYVPAEDEVHYMELAEDCCVTDENGRKAWAMDDVWAQYWGDKDPGQQEDGAQDEYVQQQQAPRATGPYNNEHAAKCR